MPPPTATTIRTTPMDFVNPFDYQHPFDWMHRFANAVGTAQRHHPHNRGLSWIFPVRRHIQYESPENAERPADLWGMERRRILARPEWSGVSFHRSRHIAGDLAARSRRPPSPVTRPAGIFPFRILDPERDRRRSEAPRRGVVVGGSGRGWDVLEDRLLRRDAHRPAGQRRSGWGHPTFAGVITLANKLRAALVEKGLLKGGA